MIIANGTTRTYHIHSQCIGLVIGDIKRGKFYELESKSVCILHIRKFLHFIAIITAELRVIECRELSTELSMRADAVPGIWSNLAVGESVEQIIATSGPT